MLKAVPDEDSAGSVVSSPFRDNAGKSIYCVYNADPLLSWENNPFSFVMWSRQQSLSCFSCSETAGKKSVKHCPCTKAVAKSWSADESRQVVADEAARRAKRQLNSPFQYHRLPLWLGSRGMLFGTIFARIAAGHQIREAEQRQRLRWTRRRRPGLAVQPFYEQCGY